MCLLFFNSNLYTNEYVLFTEFIKQFANLRCIY